MILCTDLSIGTWRRIATTVGKHDLVAYVSDSKRCLIWFIHSAGYGFKMEIPFDTIVDTQFTNAAPGSGLASFVLSEPPIFYLENVCTPRPDGSGGRIWKRCADWTEGTQATKVLRHDLMGSAVQLAHLLRNLSTGTDSSEVQLHTPQYVTGSAPSVPPVVIPQPPMAGLSGPGFHQETSDVPQTDYFIHGRKRSYSGPASLHHPDNGSDLPSIDISATAGVLRGPASATYPSSSYHQPLHRSHSNPYHSPMFSDYPDSQSHHQTRTDYESVHLENSHVPRMYSRSFYDDEARIEAPYPLEALRRDSSGSASITDLDTPSPPILTTPFHPPSDMLHHPKPSEVITGMPGILYESDEDNHHGHEIPCIRYHD
jgi:regulatory protein PHO2